MPTRWGPLSLEELIAKRIAELREKNGWTQDELAVKMRFEGYSTWTRSTVASVEKYADDKRTRRTSLAELIGLALVFDVSLREFVKSRDDTIMLSDNMGTSPEILASFFGRSKPSKGHSLLDPNARPELTEKSKRIVVYSEQELEQTIARNLGIDAFLVALTAEQLYGHGASQERDKRAIGKPTSKQHISRQIHREIAEAREGK